MSARANRMIIRFGSSRRGDADRTDGLTRSRTRALAGTAAEALGLTPDAVVAATVTHTLSDRTLAELARMCLDRADGCAVAHPAAARPFYQLALELQQAALDLQRDALDTRFHRLSACVDGLARLRTISHADDLLDAACRELVDRCGFGRAVVSRVDQGAWAPHAAHFGAGDGGWFTGWVDTPIPLRSAIPESRTVLERRPALVADTASANVHRPIIVDSGRSTSYVVAPIMLGGNVVGLVHADHYSGGPRVGTTDRDLLSVFADGVGRLCERLSLIERIDAQRNEVDAIMTDTLRQSGENNRAVGDLLGMGVPVAIRQFDDLTPREAEVLRLMVVGRSNQLIAAQLGISLDTVKSHVKQVLRKLGALNRAQAIALAAGPSE